MSDASEAWSNHYRNMIDRNLGLLNEEQQERLRSSRVAVFGLGGIGGPAFEILVRCGIGSFSIVDRDRYDQTNLNRQILADASTLGQLKIDVSRDWALSVNPELVIDAYDRVDTQNIADILQGADLGVLAIDELPPCVIISRQARSMDLPIVEGWAIPYGNVRVISSNTPSLEETYGLTTTGRDISTISAEEWTAQGVAVLQGLGRLPGVMDFYGPEAIQSIMAGRMTSFAPMVWLTSTLMALEAVKTLLDWGIPALGPEFTLYDPFQHRIPSPSENS